MWTNPPSHDFRCSKRERQTLLDMEVGGCVSKEVLDYSIPTTSGTPDATLSEGIDLILGTGPAWQLQALNSGNSEDEGSIQNSQP